MQVVKERPLVEERSPLVEEGHSQNGNPESWKHPPPLTRIAREEGKHPGHESQGKQARHRGPSNVGEEGKHSSQSNGAKHEATVMAATNNATVMAVKASGGRGQQSMPQQTHPQSWGGKPPIFFEKGGGGSPPIYAPLLS